MLEFIGATPQHAATVQGLLTSVQQWLSERRLIQWSKAFPAYWLQKQLEDGHFYLVQKESVPVATFRLLYEDLMFWGTPESSALYIHTLAVSRDAKGQQIGLRILDWVAAKARQENIAFVRLDCLADNPILVAYYANYGFEAVGKKWINGAEYMLFDLPVVH